MDFILEFKSYTRNTKRFFGVGVKFGNEMDNRAISINPDGWGKLDVEPVCGKLVAFKYVNGRISDISLTDEGKLEYEKFKESFSNDELIDDLGSGVSIGHQDSIEI